MNKNSCAVSHATKQKTRESDSITRNIPHVTPFRTALQSRGKVNWKLDLHHVFLYGAVLIVKRANNSPFIMVDGRWTSVPPNDLQVDLSNAFEDGRACLESLGERRRRGRVSQEEEAAVMESLKERFRVEYRKVWGSESYDRIRNALLIALSFTRRQAAIPGGFRY